MNDSTEAPIVKALKCPICQQPLPEDPFAIVEVTRVGEFYAARIFKGGKPVHNTICGWQNQRERLVDKCEAWAAKHAINLHFHWPQEKPAKEAA